MIEMALDRVRNVFSDMSTLYSTRTDENNLIQNLTEELKNLQENSKKSKSTLEYKLQELQLSYDTLKETLDSELKFKYQREIETKVGILMKKNDDLSSQLSLSKEKLGERRIDEEKFNQMNLRLKEKDNVINEKNNINETMKAQIKLKEGEIEEMRTAIGYFQSALEESRVREMNNKFK